MFLENILLALHNLKANKIKTFLTELGIIIGIFSVILIMTLGDTLSLAINQNMQTMGANDVYLMVTSKEAEEDISDIDGIIFGKAPAPEISEDDYLTNEMLLEMCSRFEDEIYALNISNNAGSGTVTNKNNSQSVILTGTSTGYFVTNSIDILAGNMFSENDYNEHKRVAMVSKDFIDDLYEVEYSEVIGKEITVELGGKSETLTIICVYESTSATAMQMSMFMSGSTIYIPLMTSFDINHEEPRFQTVQVISEITTDPDELAGKLETFLKNYYRLNRRADVSAITFTSIMSIVNVLLDTVTMVIAVILGISLLVGGIGIMNIMLATIMERTKEIGTRVSLGASKNAIRAQFLTEAVIICLMGGAIGVALGIISGIAASTYMGYPTFPSFDAIIIALSFSVAVGLFFGYYPANKAANMNPIDALRHE